MFALEPHDRHKDRPNVRVLVAHTHTHHALRISHLAGCISDEQEVRPEQKHVMTELHIVLFQTDTNHL